MQQFDDKQSPQDYIEALGRFGGSAGLHRMRALMNALGNPQDRLRVVHIAGTNGKGSVCTMLASVLQRANYRTGLFTSPYLLHYTERIRVDGAEIPQDELARLTAKVSQAAAALCLPDDERLTAFEFITAVSFLYFVQTKCDIVVLETGLGGRFDATNVIAQPLLCIITPISLDHTAILGDTLEKIALEKAGILKSGAAVVLAEQPPEAQRALQLACKQKELAPLDEQNAVKPLRLDQNGCAFVYGGQAYFTPMCGRHQLSNAKTVLQSVSALRSLGISIPEAAVTEGLAAGRIAGRLSRLRESPLVLVDGAHNEGGIRALCTFVDEVLKMRRIFVVMGMMRDKAFEVCVPPMAKRAHRFYACACENERALPAHTLAALAEPHCREVFDCPSLADALARALQEAAPEDCVLVCGSLFVVGEAEKLLRVK